MNITKEDRHNYSKKRRKLVRQGLNPYDDSMLKNLDKEWAQLRLRIRTIKYTNLGTIVLMNDFEDSYYSELGINEELEKLKYEIDILRESITDEELLKELEIILAEFIMVGENIDSYLSLKKLIVRLQAKLGLPIHFYEALDDEYKCVYQKVMSGTYRSE